MSVTTRTTNPRHRKQSIKGAAVPFAGRLVVLVVLILVMASLRIVTSEASARAGAAVSPVKISSNINYGPSTLDSYFVGAKKGPLRPAIVLVHGGGWTHGDKTDPKVVTIADDMARAGYAVFNINYPLASATVSGYPMELQAVRSAVNYVKKNSAKFYVDPRRIGLLGGSSGANLVYTAGLIINRTSPDTVGAVAGLSGLTQLWQSYLDSLAAVGAGNADPHLLVGLTNLRYYLGCPNTPCSQTTADAASPYTNVNPNCPANNIMASEGEALPLEQTTNFADALTAAGCTVKLDIIPGSEHGLFYWQTVKSGVVEFFDTQL
jgi:acetyl esterase